MEAAKGTNLYFAVFESKEGKRSYDSIPLNVVIERLKQGLPPVDLKSENDFYLTPNDLVYVPNEDEKINISVSKQIEITKENRQNIYKVVSFSGNQIFFVRNEIATSIINKAEFSTLNKMERALDGTMIKESCIKLKVDRLGNISL